MSDQNPHPGDIRHSQIPVGRPLGLDIDRCIIMFDAVPKQLGYVKELNKKKKLNHLQFRSFARFFLVFSHSNQTKDFILLLR